MISAVIFFWFRKYDPNARPIASVDFTRYLVILLSESDSLDLSLSPQLLPSVNGAAMLLCPRLSVLSACCSTVQGRPAFSSIRTRQVAYLRSAAAQCYF